MSKERERNGVQFFSIANALAKNGGDLFTSKEALQNAEDSHSNSTATEQTPEINQQESFCSISNPTRNFVRNTALFTPSSSPESPASRKLNEELRSYFDTIQT